MSEEQLEILRGYCEPNSEWVVTQIHFNRFAPNPILEVKTRMLVPGEGMFEFQDGFDAEGSTVYTHNINLKESAMY